MIQEPEVGSASASAAGAQPAPTQPLPTPSSGATPSQPQSGGPVGSGNYEVQPGDCIESIAFSHGHFWETVWNHPDNQQLKSVRKDHNVLMAGDKVFIPDLRPKNESGATEKRHRFKRKGVPSKLCIVLKDRGDPRPNVPYTLEVDGTIITGQTDANGQLEHSIPPGAQRGKLLVGNAEPREEYLLQLGGLDPIGEISGVQSRLNNLGFDCGVVNNQLNEQTQQAIQSFQSRQQLTLTGKPDAATQQKLKEVYGI